VTGKSGRGTARQTFRYDEDGWKDFLVIAEPDRSAVLRQFIDWYRGIPGAKMPKRPARKSEPVAELAKEEQ
jgi:hypothetical protein